MNLKKYFFDLNFEEEIIFEVLDKTEKIIIKKHENVSTYEGTDKVYFVCGGWTRDKVKNLFYS